MYISPAKKRRQIVIALVGLLLVPASVVGFLLYRDYRLRAGPEEVPQAGRMSDLTETSVVISWTTPDSKKEGWIQWSQTPGISTGSPVAQDDRDVREGTTKERTTHYVMLSDLQPDTDYYFVIGSGAHTYKDNAGAEFTFKTPALSDDGMLTPDPVFGTVENGTDESAIVYITLENTAGEKSFPISALTNSQGNFEVDLSHVRKADLSGRFTYDDSTIMYVFAQGGDQGGAVLDLTVADAEDIVLTMEEGVNGDAVLAEASKLNVGSDVPCDPVCDGKECGDDSCGGSCGTCDGGATCSAAGVCEVCEPACEGKECGDDGCGGSCGTCDTGATCSAKGICKVCEPVCTGKECGSNGCGGSCGTCDTGETCSATGTCEACQPVCGGKECGNDGCGGTCGTCPTGESCDAAGICQAGPCTPECSGRECGNDGCGGSCGTCSGSEVCSYTGVCQLADIPPSPVQDVPLTKLIVGGTTPSTGIDNILVTNVTENSFSVVWTSGTREIGSIYYGESADDLTLEALDTRDNAVSQASYYTHHVTVTNCVPETQYFYTIHSGNMEYDDDGFPYEITTPATQSSPPEFYAVFGEVTGTGKADAVVTGKVLSEGDQSSFVSTDVGDDGTWSLSLGGVRTQDYSAYFPFTDEDSLELTVRTRGNHVTQTYVLGDIVEDLVTTELNMIEGTGDPFERNLYSELPEDLPLTAINNITVLGLAISAVLIIVGSYVFIGAYNGGKNERWERSFLKHIDDD